MSVIISGTDNFVLNADSLGTAVAGAFDYDGKVFYTTPQGTQRGVVPGAQFFRLDAGLAGANVNTAQNIFGVGVTLSASTVYAFEGFYGLSKTSGSTAHSIELGFAGTATLNNILYFAGGYLIAGTFGTLDSGTECNVLNSAASNGVTSSTGASTTLSFGYVIRGTVSINAGGTFIPQYKCTVAPGGAYTTTAGSFFMIYPIGASGANTSVGTWA